MIVKMHIGPRMQRGVSLIEAVVAMAVMALGMLAVVGLQSSLRANGDIAKQRAEAVRIGQGAIEQWRSFTTMDTANGVVAYSDLVSASTTVPGINATFAVSKVVSSTASPAMKSVTTTVSWADRAGEVQSIKLSSIISGTLPSLAGTLAVPSTGSANRQPGGRRQNIPVTAKDLGDGRSGFVPPQPSGGTVTWVFDNKTGLITRICPASGVIDSGLLTQAIINNCAGATNSGFSAQLLSGFVRFATLGTQPDASQAASPSGTPLNLDISLAPGPTVAGAAVSDWSCFDDAATVASLAVPGSAVAYYCAIPSGTVGRWAGRSRISPLPGGWTIAASGVENYKVCRYTALSSDGTNQSKNEAHPLDYSDSEAAGGAFAALTNQNFLIISAAHACPLSDVPETSSDPVTYRTRLHQSGASPYTNP